MPGENKTAERYEDISPVWMSKIAPWYCQEKSRKSFLAFLKIKLDLIAIMLIISRDRYFY